MMAWRDMERASFLCQVGQAGSCTSRLDTLQELLLPASSPPRSRGLTGGEEYARPLFDTVIGKSGCRGDVDVPRHSRLTEGPLGAGPAVPLTTPLLPSSSSSTCSENLSQPQSLPPSSPPLLFSSTTSATPPHPPLDPFPPQTQTWLSRFSSTAPGPVLWSRSMAKAARLREVMTLSRVSDL